MSAMERVPRTEMGDDLVHTIAAAHEAAVRADAVLATLLAQAMIIAEARVDELGSVTSREREMPLREMVAMIALETRQSTASVDRRMGESLELARHYPASLQSWLDGRITLPHVRIMLEAGRSLESDEQRAAYEKRVLPLAETETPGRLRRLATIAAAKIAPASLPERFEKAVVDRRVWVENLPDGMAMLGAILPSMLAHGIHDRLTKIGSALLREQKAAVERGDVVGGAGPEEGVAGAGGFGSGSDFGSDSGSGSGSECSDFGFGPGAGSDSGSGPLAPSAFGPAATRTSRTTRALTATHRRRGIDELRADVFTDLLLSAAPSDELLPAGTENTHALRGITGHVSVVVTEQTLIGSGTGVCVLAGYGPIDLGSTLGVAQAASSWDVITVNSANGQILSTRAYRPDAAMRRLLRARDEHCRRPGCTAPAGRCDIDHTVDWALGGETITTNLEHLCRGDHTMKHKTRFTIDQQPDGTIVWASPNGATSADRPRSTVSFLALADDAPF